VGRFVIAFGEKGLAKTTKCNEIHTKELQKPKQAAKLKPEEKGEPKTVKSPYRMCAYKRAGGKLTRRSEVTQGTGEEVGAVEGRRMGKHKEKGE